MNAKKHKRPIGGTQYLVWCGESPEDRAGREALERGVRLRQDGTRALFRREDPDEAPMFDGREPGCILDRREG